MQSRLVCTVLVAFVLASFGCVVVDGDAGGPPPQRSASRQPGPPPHAPAHGYRHKHHGRDLVFDSDLGVYVVVGLPDLWFLDGSYYRWYGERWEIGIDIAGPWRLAPERSIPGRLREKRHPHGGPPGQQKKRGKH
jgi:hypothetical protein